MPHDIKESDWKVLRRLHPIALERFCERVLMEIGSVKNDDARNFHERYLDIFKIVERCDREIACIFDDLKRSRALMMLAAMCSVGLLTGGPALPVSVRKHVVPLICSEESLGRRGRKSRRPVLTVWWLAK